MPLNILRKVEKSAYLTFILLILVLKVIETLATSGMFNSNFELKIQKRNSHFAFLETILIHMDSALKYT